MDALINTAMTALKSGQQSAQIVVHSVKKKFFLYCSIPLQVNSKEKKFKTAKLVMIYNLNLIVWFAIREFYFEI